MSKRSFDVMACKKSASQSDSMQSMDANDCIEFKQDVDDNSGLLADSNTNCDSQADSDYQVGTFKRRNQSMVWRYMLRVEENKAQCMICSAIVPCVGGCTSGLRRHLAYRHMLSTTQTGSNSPVPTSSPTPAPQSVKKSVAQKSPFHESRQESGTSKLMLAVASSALPLSVLENEEFCKFVRYLEPLFKMPCAHDMAQRLDAAKTSKSRIMKTSLTMAPTLALTTDMWIGTGGGVHNVCYLSVTVSYINEIWKLVSWTLSNYRIESDASSGDVASQLLSSATDWGIRSKVKVIVHNDDANMKEVGRQNGWKDINCAANCLHLAIMDALSFENVQSTNTLSSCVDSACQLVKYFGSNPAALAALNKQQIEMGIVDAADEPLKLVSAVKTRWNSIYSMFDRLLKLRWPLVSVLFDDEILDSTVGKDFDLSDEYWQLIKDILPTLESLNVATELLCADSVHCSAVFPILNKLLSSNLANDADDSDVLREFKEDMRCSLVTRFALDDVDTPTHPFAIATVLDPATKKMELFDDDFRQAAYTRVREMTSSSSERRLDSHSDSSGSPPPSKRSNTDIRATMLNFLSCPRSVRVTQPTQSEFDEYLAASVDNSVDTLRWWAVNEDRFPNVAALARRFLAVPATSLLSARRFSSAGRLELDIRSRIDSDYMDCLLFVHENMIH